MSSRTSWRTRTFLAAGVVASVGLMGFLVSDRIEALMPGNEGLPTSSVSKGFISSQPEARLLYPDARVISQDAVSEDARSNTAARIRTKVASTAASTAVLDWYANALEGRSWRLVRSSDNRNLKLRDGLQRIRAFERGARERLELYACDGCVIDGPLGPEPDGRDEIDIDYSILPASCAGKPSCGQGFYIGGT
ncbi:MAG: hypothetical protein QOE92_2021 [Chloroflexota bacterium]|nr:hypothetical protein [Chloroflexota bacterium]